MTEPVVPAAATPAAAAAPTTSGLVEPRVPKGMRDYLPADMIARNRVVERVRAVYERFGFVPIDTPVIEYLDTLLGAGGEQANKELFRLETPEEEPAALRFDLTVPFARMLAQHAVELKLPFRRYHIGPVFRADKPGPGRFRQFTQFDIDAAGSESVAVDAEIVAAMAEALGSLGLRRGNGAEGQPAEFRIRINSRRVLDALLFGVGIETPEVQKHVLRVIDKLDKVGLENIRRELGPGRIDDSGDKIRGVGLAEGTIDAVIRFLGIRGETRAAVLAAIERELPAGERTTRAVEELRTLDAALGALGIAESEAVFEPALARGLEYYTGPVFETVLPAAPEFGSIMGGGRYDGLVARFLPTPIPATGASIGLDRLLAALAHLGRIELTPTTAQVLVVMMKGVAPAEGLAVARLLREAGIPTEVYSGAANASFKAQLGHANHRAIPIAAILGEDEVKAGTVAVKDLDAGAKARAAIQDHAEYKKLGTVTQVTVPRAQVVEAVKSFLAAKG